MTDSVLNDLAEVTSLYNEIKTEEVSRTLDELKVLLADKADRLKALDEETAELEALQKKIDEEYNQIIDEIKSAWAPFTKGADKSKMDFPNGLVLESENKTSIAKDDEDQVSSWLMDNGFSHAFKYQIHSATFGSIAQKLLKEEGTKIPGARYTPFTIVKVKERKTK